MSTLTLSGTLTTATDITSGHAGWSGTPGADTIDCTAASFQPPFTGVEYPFQISSIPGSSVTASGGTVLGNIPSCVWWSSFYNITDGDQYNGPSVLVDGGFSCTFDGWVLGSKDGIYSMADGFRANHTSGVCTISNCESWHQRDDILESDDNIRDVVMTNVFVDFAFAGLSATGSVAAKTITCTNVQIRCSKRWGYGGSGSSPNEPPDAVDFQQGPLFKVTAGTGPNWVLQNFVIATETASYIGASTQTDDMLANLTNNGGNEFLFLGGAAADNASHPTKAELEAAGFTVYEQQAAIERWNFHKANHLGFGMVAV